MTPPPPPPFARNLPWTSVKRAAEAGAIALVPVGSTEAHGPHLPLGTDVIIAEAVAVQAADKLAKRGAEALIFPACAYSLTEFARPWPGTVSVGADASRAYLAEVLAALARTPFRRVGVINHHLEPAHFRVVRDAAKLAAERVPGADVRVVDHRHPPFSELLGEEFTRGGSHSGWYETSLVMAAAPHLVYHHVREKLPAIPVDLPALIKEGKKDFLECGGPAAYLGDPASASVKDGVRLLNLLADHACEALLG
jgi:creatinine amidohydrolase